MIKMMVMKPLMGLVGGEFKDWEHERVCHQTLGSKDMFFFLQVFPILAWSCFKLTLSFSYSILAFKFFQSLLGIC
jgi:hypothetical protein